MSTDVAPASAQRTHVSAPTLTVFGCGGAGINLVRMTTDAIRDNAGVVYLDTSYANIRADETLILISTGSGSGKIRAENAEAIRQQVAAMSDDQLNLSDINIIVFSLAGGTGSVVGPVLMSEIERRGKKAAVVVVADTIDELGTKNTLNTLKTLTLMCDNNHIYLPTMIFDNKQTRRVIDVSLPHRLSQLVWLLTLPAIEVDRNDRRNWLNGMKTVNAAPGMRLLHVMSAEKDDGVSVGELWAEENTIFDSVLHVRTESAGVEKSVRARVSYEGIFTTMKLVPMMGVIGNTPDAFKTLTQEIEDALTQFSSQTKHIKPVINLSDADRQAEGGLVL